MIRNRGIIVLHNFLNFKQFLNSIQNLNPNPKKIKTIRKFYDIVLVELYVDLYTEILHL